MEIKTENCGRCGRELKTEKSKLVGYGPVCKRKVDAEAERSEQLTTEESQDAEV